MIRRISLFLFVALLVAGLSMAAVSTKSKVTIVKGTIDKVDTTAHTLSVTVGTAAKNFTFNDKSYFFQGKTRVKADQLKQGDMIVVTADAKNYIRKADLAAAAAAAPAAPKPATHN